MPRRSMRLKRYSAAQALQRLLPVISHPFYLYACMPLPRLSPHLGIYLIIRPAQ